MRPDLIGHFAHQRLHGGVISADARRDGRHRGHGGDRRPPSRRAAGRSHARFGKLGTIDLRIDYLRPALGERFESRREVLRLGSRVATTRMEFRDAAGKLLATGAAAYIVS